MHGLRVAETNRARTLRQGASGAEGKLWRALHSRFVNGHRFVRRDQIGPYYADLACREARVVI